MISCILFQGSGYSISCKSIHPIEGLMHRMFGRCVFYAVLTGCFDPSIWKMIFWNSFFLLRFLVLGCCFSIQTSVLSTQHRAGTWYSHRESYQVRDKAVIIFLFQRVQTSSLTLTMIVLVFWWPLLIGPLLPQGKEDRLQNSLKTWYMTSIFHLPFFWLFD